MFNNIHHQGIAAYVILIHANHFKTGKQQQARCESYLMTRSDLIKRAIPILCLALQSASIGTILNHHCSKLHDHQLFYHSFYEQDDPSKELQPRVTVQ